ncbi:MAG: cytochrome-c peroxidase [Pseudomonadales bacterium]|nr:cytochrome-c peroxidase [Pseudomonadales bacterium]
MNNNRNYTTSPSSYLGITLISTMLFLQIGCGSSASDAELDAIILNQNLTGDPASERDLADISDPVAQLGMALFYSKSLGGAMDAACVTCHHPGLGGGDGLSFPVGVDSLDADVLGLGRTNSANLPIVPRNPC